MTNQHDSGRRDGRFSFSTPTEVEEELPFQLVGAGVNFYQYPIDRPFGYSSYQWIQTLSGSGRLILGDSAATVDQDNAMLLFPGEPHQYRAHEEPWYVSWFTFRGSQVRAMLHYMEVEHSGVYTASAPELLVDRTSKALTILQSDYPLRGVDGSGLVYQFLLDLLKYLQHDRRESRDKNTLRLKPALDLIETHLDQPLTLDDLSQSVGVTPQYFCELFRNLTDRRPTEYINLRRIDRARELLLLQPTMRIHEIARRVGFESDSYFSTVFRRVEGVSPRRYREHNAPPYTAPLTATTSES